MLVKVSIFNRKFPRYIAVIGGGRWARIIIERLMSIAPNDVKISVHSLHNSKGMESWIREKGWSKRASVFKTLPKITLDALPAVIIANSAFDHEKTIDWALNNRCSVLVEKPMCMSLSAIKRVSKIALDRGLHLAPAHVFLFADYVKNFADLLISQKDNITSIRVQWEDPESDFRYGESKKYDPGLPIHLDCLPHVISILSMFIKGSTFECKELKFMKGGSHLCIDLLYDGIPCNIELRRNAVLRNRYIEVLTKKEVFSLNFSREPGFIKINSSLIPLKLNLENQTSPVVEMLKAYLRRVADGTNDPRLNLHIGLLVGDAIEQVSKKYYSLFCRWLKEECIKESVEISSELIYSLTEALKLDGRKNYQEKEEIIIIFFNYLKEYVMVMEKNQKFDIEKFEEIIFYNQFSMQ